MPELTGTDLAREMLRIRPTLPIVLVSGYVEGKTQFEVDNSGIRAFLYKPLSKDTLVATIRRLLDEQVERVPSLIPFN